MYVLETKHGPEDANTSLQIVRCKLVDKLIDRLWRDGLVARPGRSCQVDRARTSKPGRSGQVGQLAQASQVDRAGTSQAVR